MRNGMVANMVPGSTRCKPSSRISRTANGVTAQAEIPKIALDASTMVLRINRLLAIATESFVCFMC